VSINYGVDGEGRPYQVSASSGQNPVTNTTFNPASLPTAVTYGSADSDSFTYDPNTNRLNQYQFNVNGSSLTGVLGWNANGTLQTQNITDAFNSADTQNCTYGYDDLTRIASATCGTAAAQTFSYNGDGSGAFGNISKSGSPYSFQPTYSPTTNRMTAIGSFTPTYDANGNVLNDSNHAYTWDTSSRPVTIDSVNLTYDALGRTVEQNRSGVYTQIAYAPAGQKIALMNGQTLQKAFVPLPGGGQAVYNSSGLLYYSHTDHLGSTRLASTPSRTMYFDMAYAPFGETYAASGSTDPAFTSQRQDTVAGLYDFPAREYNIQGRWPSPDPAGLAAVDPTNPQSWNRYAYVLNNPLTFKDPTGLECVWDDGSFDSIGDPGTGAQPLCDQAGGTWIDHSFFGDFGLPDWSGSANGDLAAVAAGMQAGFALVQTGSGLAGWMLVANRGAGPIDWSLLGPQVPTLTYTQQAINAIHNTLSKLPTVCGKVGAFAAAEIAGFGGFGQIDENGKASASYLVPAAPTLTDNVQLTGSGPLVFAGEGAGVLYEPDLTNYGKPAALGGYLGFSVPGTKTEGAIGFYIENPRIAGAYSCPP